MVAQLNPETFAPVPHPLTPIASDTDDVRLALETARAFQAMGDIDEAVEWLERAAERADEAGQRERALALVLATAQLANASAPAAQHPQAPSSPPPSYVRARHFVRPPPTKRPPCPPAPLLSATLSSLPPPPAARTSSVLAPPPRKSAPLPARKSSLPPVPMLPPPAILPRDSWSLKGPPRAPVPPKRSSGAAGLASPTTAEIDVEVEVDTSCAAVALQTATERPSPRADVPCTERNARPNTIRVAMTGWVRGAGPLTIERLDDGQPLPAGTMAATLVLSEDEKTITVVDVTESLV